MCNVMIRNVLKHRQAVIAKSVFVMNSDVFLLHSIENSMFRDQSVPNCFTKHGCNAAEHSLNLDVADT